MEDFVPYEVAKKLKEAGFSQDYGCYGSKFIYSDETTIKRIAEIGAYDSDYYGEDIPCPTIAQALKWLREEKGIAVLMKPNHKKTGWTWLSTVQKSYCKYEIGNPFTQHGFFDSYESAALAGIEFTLDNLI